jgi:hypothetical protein
MGMTVEPPPIRFLPVLLAVVALACDDHSVVRPSPGAGAAPVTLALKDGTIAGTVYEHGTTTPGRRAGVRLRLHTFGAREPVETVSDATGRYEFTAVPTGAAVVIAPPFDSDYRAPCPPGTDVYSGAGTVFDVHVVPTAVLASTGASHPAIRPFVHGWVLGPSGPVAGASVEMGHPGGIGDAWSATLTARNGAFLLCTAPPGVGTDQNVELRVAKDGYRPLMHVENLGWVGEVANLQLDLVPR